MLSSPQGVSALRGALLQGVEYMTTIKPRFEPVFNYGHVVQTVSVLIAVMGGVGYLATWKSDADANIRQLTAAFTKLDNMVDPLVRSQVVQDERISRLSDAVSESRIFNASVMTQLGTIREDVAAVKAKLSR